MSDRVDACIFDLDGTLVDSEPVWYESDRLMLARYGIDYGEALCRTMVGLGAADCQRILAESFPASPFNALREDERRRLKDESYVALARERLVAFPWTRPFLDALAERKVAVAIASGSSPAVIDAALEITGLGPYFAIRVSASEVARGKPEPDIFLETARRLGAAPGNCLVFEDSRYGILAARAAGMRCVAFADPAMGTSPEFGLADLVFEEGGHAADVRVMLERFFA